MIEGIWQSRGYGWVLESGADGFTLHDVNALSSMPVDHGGPGTLAQAFSDVVHEGEGSLQLKQRGDVTRYWFDRLAARPAQISAQSTLNADPVTNFEALWSIFKEHYAFFALRKVDWDVSYRALRPRITSTTTATALLTVFAELLAPLNDAHVSLRAGGTILDVTSPIRERKRALERAFSAPAWMADRLGYTQRLQSAFGAMFLGGRYRTTTNAMMVYGEAAPGIGYVSMFGEFGWADTDRARAALDLPRPRLEAASFLADEIKAINLALDEVTAALSGMRAIIVDARLNYGGYDRLALEFAGRFTRVQRVAYRKKTWANGAIVADQEIVVPPRNPSLAHLPAILLTSKQTVSAGEILVLAMKACPTVSTLGETTLGILSDNLYKRLPNGWELSLSNEIYEAPDGEVYEAFGIPPDVEAPVFDPANVKDGFRVAVDRARQLLLSRVKP